MVQVHSVPTSLLSSLKYVGKGKENICASSLLEKRYIEKVNYMVKRKKRSMADA